MFEGRPRHIVLVPNPGYFPPRALLLSELELLKGSNGSSASYLGPAVNRQPGYRRGDSQICTTHLDSELA